MDTYSIFVISKIIEKGSYRKASSELNCSQSTVSFHVEKLENELGFRLFEKVGRDMRLTEPGNLALPLFNSILENEKSLKALSFTNRQLTGKLKIFLPESILLYKFNSIIQDVKEVAPDVELEIGVDTAYKVQKQIEAGHIKLAVSFNTNNFSPQLNVVALDSYPLILVSSPTMPLPAASFLLPCQQVPTCLISEGIDTGPHKFFSRFLTRFGTSVQRTMQLQSISSVISSAVQRLGIAYLPKFAVEKELVEGSLVEVPTALGSIDLGCVLLTRKNTELSATEKLMYKVIMRHLHNPSVNKKFFFETTCLMKRKQSSIEN